MPSGNFSLRSASAINSLSSVEGEYMKPNFEEFDRHCDPSGETSQQQRFELLSAYLDGEVSPAERQQVQQWLDTDPEIQQLYVKLLRLQQSVPRIPVPSSGSSSEIGRAHV